METTEGTEARYIGIRHRVKQTAEKEARPTSLFLRSVGGEFIRELEDDNAELDFVLGRYPIVFRDVTENDDLSQFTAHQVRWRKAKKDEVITAPAGHVKIEDKITYVAHKVPDAYDGLRKGDVVAMVLGGSGDRLAYALSRRAGEVEAIVLRIPPFALKQFRALQKTPTGKEAEKDDDAKLLATLAVEQRASFYEVMPRDRDLIALREALEARTDAMKARIGCEQRLRQHFVGRVFLNPEGKYPEGSIEDLFDKEKASDVILAQLTAEEAKRDREVARAISTLAVWEHIFEPIKGVGPMIAARIVSSIIDIRRFSSKAKLKAFCGVHVMPDGRFVRRRGGAVANWNPTARQALYLLADQFNRRPDSVWGQKLLHYKKALRERHPEVVETDGKKRYTKGHIHKMALWRTITKFVEFLFTAWWQLEGGRPAQPHTPKATPPADATVSDNEAPVSPEALALALAAEHEQPAV